jgi:glycosyltransferase involved in cell wall biosynthesis
MAKAQKVLILTTGLNQGGAESLLVDFAFFIRDCGYLVEIISLIGGGFHRVRLEAGGIAVADAGMKRGKASMLGLLRAMALMRRSDATVLQSWMYHANLIGALARLPVFGSRRSTFFGLFNSMMDFRHYGLLTYVTFRLGAHLSAIVDGVVYNSAQAARHHEETGYRADKTIVIGNTINLSRFRPDIDARGKVRMELKIAPDATVLAIVARNDPQKDWPTMLDVVRRLNRTTVLAAGLGTENLPEMPNLVRLGARADIERIYAASDVFMLASRFGEGTSLALCEAMATGLPAIVTDVGDNAAIIASNAGVVVPVGDVDAISAAAQALIDDPIRRAAMSAVAIEHIRTRCTPEVAFAPLLAAYEAALLKEATSVRLAS